MTSLYLHWLTSGSPVATVVSASRLPKLSQRPTSWLSAKPSWLSSKNPSALTLMALFVENSQPSVNGGFASVEPVLTSVKS